MGYNPLCYNRVFSYQGLKAWHLPACGRLRPTSSPRAMAGRRREDSNEAGTIMIFVLLLLLIMVTTVFYWYPSHYHDCWNSFQCYWSWGSFVKELQWQCRLGCLKLSGDEGSARLVQASSREIKGSSRSMTIARELALTRWLCSLAALSKIELRTCASVSCNSGRTSRQGQQSFGLSFTADGRGLGSALPWLDVFLLHRSLHGPAGNTTSRDAKNQSHPASFCRETIWFSGIQNLSGLRLGE